MARHLSRIASGILFATVACSALTGCIAYPVGPYGVAYPAYVAPRPVVVAGYGGGYGWGWHRWR